MGPFLSPSVFLSSFILFLYSSITAFPKPLLYPRGLLDGSVVKNPPANAGDAGSIPGSGRFPWRRKWQPTPLFLPGKSHEIEEPGGLYSSWGRKRVGRDLATKQHQPQVWEYNIRDNI